MNVAACIVTRGNVDLTPLLAPYPKEMPVHVWDNSIMQDLGVYGRYAMLENVREDVVIVQDDDCVLPRETIVTLMALHTPGVIVANMPKPWRRPFYKQHCLVGFGAIFDRDLPPQAFAKLGFDGRVSPFLEDDWWDYTHRVDGVTVSFPNSAMIRRTSDVAFTALTPFKQVDLPVEILDYARGDGRMFRDQNHFIERNEMLQACLKIKAAT